ncbi:MAG: exodeoxyribonuclease V subunit gamma, partial [Deltaproteobacteria bacterium]|nr:exodeoxyribonuclease V subunit gamma [Deltaproteobacteria bacterium]
PAVAGEHRFLAELLSVLERELPPSPAARLAALEALPAATTGRALHVFGLSALRPGDKARLAALAPHLHVHLYVLAPSREWWADLRSRAEVRAALARTPEGPAHAELLAELGRQNRLLSLHGAPSRDLQIWLEDLRYEEGPGPDAPGAAGTLLARLQAWVDSAGDNPGPAAPGDGVGDGSLEVHACHGALRQCEALREALLRRFAADPTLEPRHVLVMTPDVETFAPLLAAVLGRRGGGVPAIPVHVADLGLTTTNPLAETLLRLLELCDERVTATRVAELLGLEPVRARFGIDADDLADLEELIEASGLRWGWDAADRAAADQPPTDQNTVRFALERLALGVLVPDPGGVAVLPAAGELGAAVPLDLGARDRVARFGMLADLLGAVAELREALLTAAGAAEWRDRLGGALDRLTLVTDDRAWLRAEVEALLDELFAPAAAGGLPFERSAAVAMLRGAFELPQKGDRPVTGAVTICAMEPMRSVPFRVVAVVGLDDGAFPRAARPAAWDPLAARRHDEHDRRALDRHLFLEALLCARDALLLFGTGFGPRRGEKVPLSVVVEELLEVIGDGARRTHPLQPWSDQTFTSPAELPHDALWASAARALREERPARELLDERYPPAAATRSSVTVEELARALEHGPKEFFSKTLRLSGAQEGGALPDREAFELDDLGSWQLRDRLLSLPAVNEAAASARFAAEGVIPLGAAGLSVAGVSAAKAQAVREAAFEGGEPPTRSEPRTVQVGDVLVHAGPVWERARAGASEQVFLSASKAGKDRPLLHAFFAGLAARAAGADVQRVRVISQGKDGPVTVELALPRDPAEASRLLAEVVALWQDCAGRPVLLLPKLSRAVAEARRGAPELPPEEALVAAGDSWEGSGDRPGLCGDHWVQVLLGDRELEDLRPLAGPIAEVADRLYGPILAAEVASGAPGAQGGEPA